MMFANKDMVGPLTQTIAQLKGLFLQLVEILVTCINPPKKLFLKAPKALNHEIMLQVCKYIEGRTEHKTGVLCLLGCQVQQVFPGFRAY